MSYFTLYTLPDIFLAMKIFKKLDWKISRPTVKLEHCKGVFELIL